MQTSGASTPREILDRTPFFQGLSAAGRDALAGLAILRPVPKQTVLFMEGDRGHSMYLLVEGRVQLHKTTPDGREVVLKVLKPGEVFAVVVLFERECFPATATALTESRVLMFPSRAIHGRLEDATFRRDFIALLMQQQRYLTERIVTLTTDDVEARLLAFLDGERAGRQRFTLAMPKKDIAAAIGTTPETISRLIRRLQAAGRLRWQGRTVTWGDAPPRSPT